jgi:hypothetical protein
MQTTNQYPQPNNVTPQPYVSDGGFSITGMMITMGVGMTTALTVGVLAGIIGQYFYMVLIFPLVIGGAVGGAQVLMIDKSRIRNPMICGVSGLLAGFVAVVAMHYVDYFVFQQSMKDEAAQFAELVQTAAEREEGDPFVEALAEYQNDPEIMEANNVDTFIGYVDWSAKQGVELSSATSTSSGSNLGYVGTYVYWGFEALVIAGLCVMMTRKQSARPFCVACDRWMKETELVALNCKAKSAADALASAQLDRLTSLFAPNQETAISVFDCETCSSGDAVLQPSEVTYNNGSRCLSPAGRFVYPAAVVDDFVQTLVQGEANDEDESGDATPELESTIQ